jgi:hypothetical protein
MGGTVRASWPWPDLASLGLGVLAVALGAWYQVDNSLKRERRYAAAKWADLSLPQTEAEEPTGAEEILVASPGRVVDRLSGAGADLIAWTLQATGGHRWIRLAAAASVLLFLTCLVVVLSIPLLLMMVFSYVSDSGHDIRLRIIVGLLLVEIALQGIAHV